MTEEIISVIGLGYVGLPLASALSNHYKVIGFDTNENRVDELRQGLDLKKTVNFDKINLDSLIFTSSIDCIKNASFYIITVPTPVDESNKPELIYIKQACEIIGAALTEGDIVMLESTVSPSTTEEYCIRILENISGLQLNKNFYIGYSPERINPGFYNSRFLENTKIISSSCNVGGRLRIENVYKKIFKSNYIFTDDIKLAEACKLVENIQRDVNIALMNELLNLFSTVNMDIYKIIKLCMTKWNFSEYYPGLVGGHCISVDPYYLIDFAENKNISLDLVKLARKINSEKVNIIHQKIKSILRDGSSVGLLGLSYKPDINDVRNSQSIILAQLLAKDGLDIKIHDPHITQNQLPDELKFVYERSFENTLQCEVLVISIKHEEYKALSEPSLLNTYVSNKVVIDLVGLFSVNDCSAQEQYKIHHILM